jgi:hypothetical protein
LNTSDLPAVDVTREPAGGIGLLLLQLDTNSADKNSAVNKRNPIVLLLWEFIGSP